ncbi:hypothetical protein AAFF_G00111890 [Aldrovandia affinis]|uniref:Uncharacterized protein n=1 Tax=Aldrovandia affinis TaxID=143900 RepID=A0AAD7WAY8_9TELE|nr:hypothetical protein AAFF_G00111890 [Aldrovandia affinis]
MFRVSAPTLTPKLGGPRACGVPPAPSCWAPRGGVLHSDLPLRDRGPKPAPPPPSSAKSGKSSRSSNTRLKCTRSLARRPPLENLLFRHEVDSQGSPL